MRRTAALLSCALLLSTAGFATAPAGAQTERPQATENTVRHPRPATPVAARAMSRALGARAALAQETQPQASGSAEDALKAEMDKRWPDAERIYRGLLAKEPDRL